MVNRKYKEEVHNWHSKFQETKRRGVVKKIYGILNSMEVTPESIITDRTFPVIIYASHIEEYSYHHSTSLDEYLNFIIKQVNCTRNCLAASRKEMESINKFPFIFTFDVVQRELLESWKNVNDCEDSKPFRFPMDVQGQEAEGYFKLITKPMDLDTVYHKLMKGDYEDPWEYIMEMWLIFENAWRYNSKPTKVYKAATKLSEIFNASVDIAMKRLGYCCGTLHVFQNSSLVCDGKEICTVEYGENYFAFQDNYVYCKKCFTQVKGNYIILKSKESDDQEMSELVAKGDFVVKQHHLRELEPFIVCVKCTKRFHRICVLQLNFFTSSFQCDLCREHYRLKKPVNMYLAKNIPQTRLGSFIEKKVKDFLSRHKVETGEVTIRVLECSEKKVNIKPQMRDKYTEAKRRCQRLPYRQKVLYAFQSIDGVDVAFFALYVQEYGSDCPAPNTRRVYVSYLDSVHFFRPRKYRTGVYYQIMLGYFEYVKILGFEIIHIWACPPNEGSDYIFNCHPVEQKVPKQKRLLEWYKKLLDTGVQEKILIGYTNLFNHALEGKAIAAVDMPYFDGDFWPDKLEKDVEEVDKNKDVTRSSDTPHKKNKRRKSKSRVQQVVDNLKETDSPMDELSEKLLNDVHQHKEMFFVVRLNSSEDLASLPAIMDPDPLIPCEIMDGRDAFLTLAREERYEFSSLRRAKYATLGLLYELIQNEIITCNNCNETLKPARRPFYSCTICKDYDLCIDCSIHSKHPHLMLERPADNRMEDGPGGLDDIVIWRIQLRFFHKLDHSFRCKEPNCTIRVCKETKRLVTHSRICVFKTSGGCRKCCFLMRMCTHHAGQCASSECNLPFCQSIKERFIINWSRRTRIRNMMLSEAIRLELQAKYANQADFSPGRDSGISDPDKPYNNNYVSIELAISELLKKYSSRYPEIVIEPQPVCRESEPERSDSVDFSSPPDSVDRYSAFYAGIGGTSTPVINDPPSPVPPKELLVDTIFVNPVCSRIDDFVVERLQPEEKQVDWQSR